jgi:hypothetical protein
MVEHFSFQHYAKRAMLITNDDLKVNNEETNHKTLWQKPECLNIDSKWNACQHAYRKPKKERTVQESRNC